MDLTAVPKQVRGRDYDGAYRSSPEHRAYATARRRVLRLAGLCINGELHGQANPVSGKCDRCEDIARRTR